MKAFTYSFKTVLIILLLSFMGDKFIFYMMNKISDQVYSGQSIGKLNQYLSIKDTLDLVVFGSSRANHNINPNIISANSYNMGMDGRKVAFSATLIKLLPHNKQQVVLLHIDPNNAFDKKYNGIDLDALAVKYNRNRIIKNEIDRLNQNNPFQIFFWSISYNSKTLGVVKNFLQPKYNYKQYNGYDPITPSQAQIQIFKNKLAIKKNIKCQEDIILNKIYSDYLNELVSFCNKNNKKLIIFTSPIYNDKCKTDNIKFQKIMQKRKIEYYDFTDFFKKNNKFEYWKDEIHLSAIGSKIFTKKVSIIISK